MDEVTVTKRRRYSYYSTLMINRVDLEPLHLKEGEQLEITLKKITPQEAIENVG